MITAQEFRNQYLGKAIDVDDAYGAQCVDLFKQVCYLASMKPFALGGFWLCGRDRETLSAIGT